MITFSNTLFLFFALNARAEASIENDLESPQATIKSGTVEGTWKISVDGRQYAAFEGIPFAKPPVGDLRFKEPQPYESWTGIWKANKIYNCPQAPLTLQVSGIIGDEDCLYLNVFVPKIQKTQDLDVLVHIHGGAFFTGNSVAYIDPKYIMDRDWILVTMNYRLGALGFLSTEDDVVPGNNGLKDQSLALRWIQNNIANFGGNPNSVTITGFSAGSASSHFQYFSPMNKGLFHRGMSNSGTALCPWAIADHPLQRAKKLAKSLGCEEPNNDKMVECIRQRPASLIVKNTVEYMHPFSPAPFCPFAPVVEKSSPSKEKFLAENPYQLLKEGRILDVPWIASATTEDGLVISLALSHRYQEIQERYFEVAKYLFDYVDEITPEREIEVATKIRDFYLPKGSKFDSPENEQAIVKMFTDRIMSLPAENAAKLQAAVSKAPVYFYKFQYEGANSWKLLFTDEYIKGAAHGDDLIYTMGGQITRPLTDKDNVLRNILMDALYAYVHTGVPVTEQVHWDPVGDKFNYLNISGPDTIKMEVKEDFSTNNFWKNLGLEYEDSLEVKDEL